MPMIRINGSTPITPLPFIAPKVRLHKPNNHENLRGDWRGSFNQRCIGSLVNLLQNPVLMCFNAASVIPRHMGIKFEN